MKLGLLIGWGSSVMHNNLDVTNGTLRNIEEFTFLCFFFYFWLWLLHIIFTQHSFLDTAYQILTKQT